MFRFLYDMSIYDSLNDRQKEGVFTTEGPVLLLAGAGSGKTRVLTHRIVYLIEEQNVDPWNIMAITFTNKAAGEMRKRVDDLVGAGSESVWVMTFHSTCVRILRRFGDRLGYDNNFTIYDTDDSKSLMKDICKRLQIDTKYLKEKAILSAISSAKNDNIGVDEYRVSAIGDYSKQKIALAYAEYQDALKKNNALDFDDLLVKTVELFKTCPDVLAGYQRRFQYIMVDEYQDTNTVQFELIRLLADAHHNLCVVGDDDQSIYKFRGANIRNILDFEKHYPEAAVIKLEQNYRSTQNILDAANSVIANNKGRKEKALWTSGECGSLIHFRPHDNAFGEAEFIADEIAHKCRKENLPYSSFAVLFRTNAQSRLLEERFVYEGIPYRLVGGVNFYARKEIKDLMSYLKTIAGGRDDLAVKRIINVPKRGIGASTLSKVEEYALSKDMSFFDALREADKIPGLQRAASKLLSFVTQIGVLAAKVKIMGIAGTLKELIDSVSYIDYLREEDDDEKVEERMQNIDELISKITAFEENSEDPSLGAFLQETALMTDLDNTEDGENRVVLMTLHSAKGLEFDNVYLAGMEDGLFPSYMSIATGDTSEVEEERRLAYVGITRAKKELTLTYAKSRMIRGETQYNDVSRFVREIPEALLDNRPSKKHSSYDDYEGIGESAESFVDRFFKMQSESSKEVYEEPVQKPSYNRDTVFDLKKPTGRGGDDRLKNLYGVSKPVAKPTAYGQIFAAKGISKAGMQEAAEPDYTVGDRVKHIKFGEGTVVALVKEAKDYKVTVNFDGLGTKIMYAMFAKLQKM